jgi:hypothetical protein
VVVLTEALGSKNWVQGTRETWRDMKPFNHGTQLLEAVWLPSCSWIERPLSGPCGSDV